MEHAASLLEGKRYVPLRSQRRIPRGARAQNRSSVLYGWALVRDLRREPVLVTMSAMMVNAYPVHVTSLVPCDVCENPTYLRGAVLEQFALVG
jgi:hypothetical protein